MNVALYFKGGWIMDYRIIEKEAFKVIGRVFTVSTKDGEHNKKIAQIWEECNGNGTSEKICAVDNKQDMLGVCLDFDEKTRNYLIWLQ
jgi:AraC family transcriptional regulator